MHEQTHTGDLIVQISRLSTTVLILIFWVKRPEIDEICRNLSCKGVNGWKFYKTQTTMLCNTIILRKAEMCPSKISHILYKQSLLIFLQTARPILIVSEHSPFIFADHALICIYISQSAHVANHIRMIGHTFFNDYP